MVTPSVPGAINITDLTGEEVVALQSGAGAAQTTTALIAALGGGAKKFLPFFGDTSVPWARPGLSIGGSGNNFTLWLNQGGQAYDIGTDTPPHNGAPVDPGIHYAPGDTVTLGGGTLLAAGGIPTPAHTELTVTDTQLVSATIVAAGTGGTPGSAQVIGTTGTGTMFILDVTINGSGHISSIDDINAAGDYTVNPTDLTDEPVADNSSSGITGASVSVVMGALLAEIAVAGAYATPPANPVSQASSSGSGTGATWDLGFTALASATDGTGGLPLIVKANSPALVNASLGLGGLLTGLLIPIGAPPWTLTDAVAGFYTWQYFNPGNAALVLYNSETDKAVALLGLAGSSTGSGSGGWVVFHYTDVSNPSPSNQPTIAAGGYLTAAVTGLGYFSWWQISNDGTTLDFLASAEGQAFVGLSANQSQSPTTDGSYTETLESFIGSVTHVGFGIDRSSFANDVLTILWNWVQS